MTDLIEVQKERLILRQWRKEDWPGFAIINADPGVMEFYPCTLSTEESDAFAKKLELLISENGWGLWAVESISEKSFVGFVGLHETTFDLPVTPPCVEIGWRLAKEYWGKGYATEAAKASLDIAFNRLGLSEVFSFTSVLNEKSWEVMERLGMTNTHENFEHPVLPKNHPLREHVLYRIDRQQWDENSLYPSNYDL